MPKFVLRLIALILLFSATIDARQEMAICTIFQNEGPWLKEWIEFHRLQGVTHFYLYNNNSTDNYLTVLQPYINQNVVTLVEWPYTYDEGDHAHWIQIQTGAYRNCIKKWGKEIDWLAVIDSDEFLFCAEGEKLPDFLKNYHQFGGLVVNWAKFGTSDVEEIPPGTLMIEVLTRCLKDFNPDNHIVKTIVQPKYVTGCISPHWFQYVKGRHAVNSAKEPIEGKFTPKVRLNTIRINHYWTRSKKYLFEEKIPSRQKRRDAWTTDRILEMCNQFNSTEDKAILQYVQPLRKLMGYAN